MKVNTIRVGRRLWLAAAAVCVVLFAACRRGEEGHEAYDRLFRQGREQVMFVGNEQAERDARAMLGRAERENCRYGKVMAYLSLASLAAQSGDYDDMARDMEVARASLDLSDPPFLQGYAYFVEGTVDYSTTLSINSQLCYDKALHYFKLLRDSLMIASCYVNKSNCYYINGNPDAAGGCVDSARHWAPRVFRYNIQLYEAMQMNYTGASQRAVAAYARIVDSAMSDTLLPSKPSAASARFWSILYSNYILALLGSGDIDSAQRRHDELWRIAEDYGSEFDRANCRIMQAWIEAARENLDSAIGIGSRVYATYKGYHELSVKRQAVVLLEECHTLRNDYQQALMYNRIKDSLSAGRTSDARMLEEILDRQRVYEDNIHKLEVETAYFRTWLLLTVFLLVLIAAASLLYRQNHRLKEHQARVRELENEQRLRAQQSEIASARMENAATMEQMSSFAGEVRRIAYDMPQNQRARLLMGISRLEELLGRDAWATFEEGFEQQYPGFLGALSGQYPDIQNIELKMCMLIRAGLSNREIADTLHLADNTVRTYRVRIRKKMGVGEGADLSEFIASLGRNSEE